ncbi:MAG: hypothetical protein H6Q13_858 [Bacteroidetes bacterium]|nr:hypothetical protein [Bacteroidota bacterium]
MTTQKLEAMKAMLTREVLSIDNEKTANKLMDYLCQLKAEEKNPPCQFTIEELKEEIKKSMKDIDAGHFTSQEDLLREMKTW